MNLNTPSETISSKPGLTYCTHDGFELKGDLYLPRGDGAFPILIGAPGGAWRLCARASLQQWGHYLAGCGYGLFAIDYRVATASRKIFPEAVQDVISAVRFIRGSASGLSIDPERVGLLGASAGAHLTALAALAHDKPAFGSAYPDDEFANISAAVKVLVSIYGIYDLFKQWQDDLCLNPGPENNVTRNLIGKDPYEDQQAYFEASPLSHITYGKNRMPILVSWGTSDEWVNPTQSEVFVRRLQQAGFNVRTHRVVGASHFWFNQPLEEPSNDSAHLATRLIFFLHTAL